MTDPQLSVVIPTFNRHTILKSCLDSLKNQTLPRTEFEVIVVDDGSQPPVEMFDSIGNVQLIRSAHVGPATARNMGIRCAKAGIVLFIDDDIWIAPSTLEQHLAKHSMEQGAHAIQGTATWHPALRISHFMRWLEDGGPQFSFNEIPLYGPNYYYFYTCHLSFKRAVFDHIGLFDPELSTGVYEDLEFGYRFFQANLVDSYDPNLQGFHYRPVPSIKEYCDTRMVLLGRSYSLFARKVPAEQERFKQVVDELLTRGGLSYRSYVEEQTYLLGQVAKQEIGVKALNPELRFLYTQLTDLSWKFGIWMSQSARD